MKAGTVHLPVFSPTRFVQGTTTDVSHGSIWCVSDDTTYQYDSMSQPVPVKAGMVRGVPNGASSITFSDAVTIEIQE